MKKEKIIRHKARIVAKEFSQIPGRDYEETYAPMACMETIRMLIATAIHNRYSIHQMDVKSPFLNEINAEEIYVQQSQGFEIPAEEEKVYRLAKALYGLKQAPRAWNSNIDMHLIRSSFERCPVEPSLYTKRSQGEIIILLLYVDDLIITGSSPEMIREFKMNLMQQYEMPDLGLMKFFLGIQDQQASNFIFLSQEKCARVLLVKFQLDGVNSTTSPMATSDKLGKRKEEEEKCNYETYRSLIGSLIYLTKTRPDLEYSVNVLSRFIFDPGKQHFAAAKRVM
ncbi:hypothetical protein KSP39_PZI018394 [Platanthera zijinensis]|uniref:Reverse transcriptase Ty1/copia-type domain-containing protein n=1 Tax=Platanthera zijinensis TaxID=2320716 RepID=A0AAP0FYU4_9ASPA